MGYKFKISAGDWKSEWLNDFESVQEEMNRVENKGRFLSKVIVERFTQQTPNCLVFNKGAIYDWNGCAWEKIKTLG